MVRSGDQFGCRCWNRLKSVDVMRMVGDAPPMSHSCALASPRSRPEVKTSGPFGPGPGTIADAAPADATASPNVAKTPTTNFRRRTETTPFVGESWVPGEPTSPSGRGEALDRGYLLVQDSPPGHEDSHQEIPPVKGFPSP